MRKLMCAAFVLLALATGFVFAQGSSPTAQVTSNQFLEASDLYLDVTKIGQLDQAVFMLNVSPSIATASSAPWIGFGSWFDALYTGAYYSFDGGITGQLAGNVSVNETQNDALIMDGLLVVGKTSVVNREVEYQLNTLQSPQLVGGYKLGDMIIGAGYGLYYIDVSSFGTYDTNGARQPAVTTTIRDTAGAVSSLVSTDYALGKQGGLYAINTLAAGVAMPLAGLKFTGYFDAGITGYNYDSTYAEETRRVYTGQGYAAYTPTLVLPGVTAAAIADNQYYDIAFKNNFNSGTTLDFTLEGKAVMPLDVFGSSEFGFGLSYAPSFTIKSAKLQDLTGAELAASSGYYFHSFSRTVDFDTATNFQTLTTNEYREYIAVSDFADSQHVIQIPLNFAVMATPDVHFAIGLKPVLEFGSESYSGTSADITTVVFEDGDGVAAATDLDDYTTVTTNTYQPYQVNTVSSAISFDLDTAVQIYLKPGKFRLNLGAQGTVNVLNREVETTTYTGTEKQTVVQTVAGVATTTTSTETLPSASEVTKETSDTSTAASVNYDVGFTYFLNPNVLFDFMVTNAAAFNLADTSNTGGFLDLGNYTIKLTIQLPN